MVVLHPFDLDNFAVMHLPPVRAVLRLLAALRLPHERLHHAAQPVILLHLKRRNRVRPLVRPVARDFDFLHGLELLPHVHQRFRHPPRHRIPSFLFSQPLLFLRCIDPNLSSAPHQLLKRQVPRTAGTPTRHQHSFCGEVRSESRSVPGGLGVEVCEEGGVDACFFQDAVEILLGLLEGFGSVVHRFIRHHIPHLQEAMLLAFSEQRRVDVHPP
mmetsp:Transcript_59806/g.136677  ORF Transcript_59806/g.136677 Transcript_59806/m.136677 type:complete len:214 (-) Transcript_59806:2617-3258(-)